MLNLYSTNPSMMREFAKILSSTYLFPSNEDRSELRRDEFLKIVQEFQFSLLKANEIRKRYTEFVCQNKMRAYLPSEKLKRNPKNKEKEKEKE